MFYAGGVADLMDVSFPKVAAPGEDGEVQADVLCQSGFSVKHPVSFIHTDLFLMPS